MQIVPVTEIALVLSEICNKALQMAVAKSQGALAVELSVLPASLVGRPVNKGHLALAATLIMIPLAFVLVSKAVHFLAKTVHDDLSCVD